MSIFYPINAQAVRESWMTYELDLINYQNKCRLIHGWDDLFNKIKEHINSVAAMKLSPYFKVFEDDAMAWEDRLNRINALFDVWIDVQRRWVYLEGIFTGSADIKHLLPNESQRFQRFVNFLFQGNQGCFCPPHSPLDLYLLPLKICCYMYVCICPLLSKILTLFMH